MADFYVSLSWLALAGWDTDFAQNFSGFKSGSEHFNEEIRRFDYAIAFGAGGDDFCIEREDGCRPVSSRIRVRDASADCSFIAHLHVTELSSRFRQERAGAAQKIGGFHLKVRRHSADAELSGFFLNIGKL